MQVHSAEKPQTIKLGLGYKESVQALKTLWTLVLRNAETSDPIQRQRAEYKPVVGQKAANKKTLLMKIK
jgi:hypothetical protein